MNETETFVVQYHDGDAWQDTYHSPFMTEANARAHAGWFRGQSADPVRIILRVVSETVLAEMPPS